MQRMKVKCPNCGRISFETTDQFNPDAIPHGGMVRCLLHYQIDWLCSSSTVSAEMTCPECLAPLVVGGVLNVVMPAREAGECFAGNQKAAIQETEFSNTHVSPGINMEKFLSYQAEIQKEMLKNEIPPIIVPEVAVIIERPDGTQTKANIVDNGRTMHIGKTEDQQTKPFVCDVCGKECKSEFGLKSHKRSHK